jgi:intergrase/recombinase
LVRLDWPRYREYLEKNNRKEYVSSRFNYALRFHDCYANPSKISTIPTSIRANVLKALITLSKYLGEYLEFKEQLKQHGIKWIKPDNFSSFLNILNDTHNDLDVWYKNVYSILNDNSRLFPRFTLLSGLRKAESIRAFNKIIELSKNGKLSEYYNKELNILEHFKYPKEFFRQTKNVYISVIPYELIEQIANSKSISYSSIRKYLQRRNIKLRLKELRSYYASYLRKHGIISELIDLLQGRISKDVFVRHYLKQEPKALSIQVLALLKDLEDTLA